MKYPDKLFIEINKKNWHKKKVKHIDWLSKNLDLTQVNISRVSNDCRAGMNYKIIKVKDYPGLLELELSRVDLKKNAK